MALLVIESKIKKFIGGTSDLSGTPPKPVITLVPENTGSTFYDKDGKQYFVWYVNGWELM